MAKGGEMEVKRVGIFSCMKIMGFVYAVLGFLAGVPLTLIALLGGAASVGQPGLAGDDSAAMVAMALGLGAIVVLPIVNGITGCFVGGVSALVYNVVAGLTGGLVVELEKR